MYDELNFDAKNYLLKELNDVYYKKYNDKNLLKRLVMAENKIYEGFKTALLEYIK